MGDLHYISATEALERFRDRSLSPVELMEVVLARAEAVESNTGAFTQIYFDEALEAARAAEARYATGEATRPLEGLPVAIKEDKGVKGKPTTAGSLVFKDSVAGGDALPVGRIKDAGGIIHARTNVCEMGTAGITGGKLQGPTRNPWNPAFNSGGPCGVPTGMQITGRPYDDLSVFRGASTYERASAWPATAGYRPQV